MATTIFNTFFYLLLCIMLMALMTNATPNKDGIDTAPGKLNMACITVCQEACSQLPIWEQVACYAGCDLVCVVECEETLGLLCKGFPKSRKLMGPANIDVFKARLVANNNVGGKVDVVGGTNVFKTEP